MHSLVKFLAFGTSAKKKLLCFTQNMLQLEKELLALEKNHFDTRERLKEILQPLLAIKEHGHSLRSLLQYSGQKWVLATPAKSKGSSYAESIACFEDLYENSPTWVSMNCKEQVEELGLVLKSLHRRLQKVQTDQDQLLNLVVILIDFVDHKTCGIMEATSTLSSQYTNVHEAFESMLDDAVGQLFPPVLAFKACTACGGKDDDFANEFHPEDNGVPSEATILLESVGLELHATYNALQFQMEECDNLLNQCQMFCKKQGKFEKAWRVPPEKAPLVLDNSDETDGDVDILVFLDEQTLAAESVLTRGHLKYKNYCS